MPKPIIARTYRTWRVPPGMIVALVQDMEHRLWVVESCPAGTQFWTLEQAAELKLGTHTRKALQEAVQLGRQTEQAQRSAKRMIEHQPQTVRLLTRALRSEKSGAKAFRQETVRPLSGTGRKTLVGV